MYELYVLECECERAVQRYRSLPSFPFSLLPSSHHTIDDHRSTHESTRAQVREPVPHCPSESPIMPERCYEVIDNRFVYRPNSRTYKTPHK